MTKTFRVAAVSTNTNSFGLWGVVVVSRSGEAWQLGGNDLHKPEVGSELAPEIKSGVPCWGRLGYEIPERLHPNAPEDVISLVWATAGR